MRDRTKPLPQLREGDKVLVRRIDTWVEAEVARCANGQVWVRWGSQARWSWRPSRIRSLPWTCAVPCDSAFLRRDLSRLTLTPAQRRSLNKRHAKAKAESDLARETRLQQRHYARKFGTAADAEGCGGDDDDDDSKNKDNSNDDYNNYYSYSSRSSTSYPGENWPDKYRTLSNPHSAWDRGGRSGTGGGSGGQYAYALYKGKQYTMAELEAVLAADRKRAPKTDPLREQIRALRQELLTFNVAPDPADDLDQFMFEEAYAASDFSSAGGDDDRGWGAEDDIADGWSQGGRQSGHSVSEARERAPRRERKPRRAAWGMDEWTLPAADEADGHPSEEPTAGYNDAHSAREVDDDDDHHHHHHDSRASSTPAAAATSEWANPYDLQFESATAGGSVSLSAFDPFPTSASASLSLAAFGPTSGGSVSYGMPETATLAAGFHLHDASRFFTSATTTAATIHAFDDNYCAPTYSDSVDFAAASSADHDYNSRYNTTADTYGYNNDYDDNNNSGSSSHHYGYGNESGEDNDNGAEEEEGDFGGLFSENAERRESRSSASTAAVTTATKKGKSGKSKAHEAAAATANSGAGGEGGKAGVIDLRQVKRRQKWEARQVKREEFKRRQRQERKLGAAN